MLHLVLLLACHGRDDSDTDVAVEAYDPIPLIDPKIGSGGIGFEVGSVNPGPLRPFGLVKVGPDTRGGAGSTEYLHCAGYHDTDDKIAAISHVHAYGMGVGDYGLFAFLPRAGWDAAYTRDNGRSALFDKATEQAEVGYYAAVLEDGVQIELTATDRGALHRYTFGATDEPTVVLDLGHVIASNDVIDGHASWDGELLHVESHVSGSYSERFGGLHGYAVAAFDPPPTGTGGWDDPASPTEDATAADGPASGMWLTWPAGTTTVTMRVGVSWVDDAGAQGNLADEIPAGTDFDDLRAASEDAWRAELASVRVRGGTDTDRVIFHTALYHAHQMPTRFDDVDGRYRGLDGDVHTADFPYYTDFSLWDTFRTQHPWLILADPERQTDMVRSLVRHVEDGGSFDRWPLGHGYTGGMVGTPTDQVIAESWLKGLRDFDVDAAFRASIAHATGPTSPVGRSGIEGYVDHGYVAWEDSGSPAALTLEYAWNDAALCAWAAAMGRGDEGLEPCQNRQSWKQTWDAERGFFIGRHLDGTFTADFDPNDWADDYVEGAAWQYLWMVPHDVPGMIELQHGGDTDAFLARLDAFWDDTYAADDTSFPDPYYWHGNEPDMHYAFLGSLAGHPEHSAAPIRWIKEHRYRAAPAGLDGNDDAGTLSAWYLWAAVGVFPVAGTDLYAIGSPWFERTEIDQPDGTTLVIAAPGASESASFVGEATVGDAPITGTFTHEQWVAAGRVALPMHE